jgi:PAS domain S-box-containing protein
MRQARGHRWLVLGRLSAALLLAGLVTISGDAFRAPDLLLAAAGGAVTVALLGWGIGRGRSFLAVLFLADLGWISVAAAGAARADAGLGLLFALVAFAAGLCLGGRLALAIGLAAGLALVATVHGEPGFGPGWSLAQGLLVLALGAASNRTRAYLAAREAELLKASQALERMRLDTDTIVQHLGSGVISIDGDGTVVHFNRVAEEMLGLRGERIRGGSLEEALSPGFRPLVELLKRGIERGEKVPRSQIEVSAGEREIPLGVSTTVLEDPYGEITGVVALFQDLSEIRRQEVLDRRRDRLAAVGELAAGMAHEIRNSLMPISGSVQLLSQALETQPAEEKLFKVVERETENIERFVSGLLRYSRGKELSPARVDLGALAREIAADALPARNQGMQFRVQARQIWAWVDEEQLRQALRNLVINAIDATGGRGAVVLRVGTDGEGRPWIEVEDDGPGIPPSERARVLEPFYTSKPGGTGLGLALVSRIVEDHEGQLQLLDGERDGARFRILLPQHDDEPGVVPHAA